ncbi:uncharacterized protein LOC141670370 [Apium graveolens]|uniref:uncharacterized protein LOC141670370 n=1 Tax=Apium graveolens TaxID=4045 RepID=UPI003D7B4741
MEFELGLKLTKCLDEFESADLVISKDGGSPVFISRETETMFILTANLRGYRREQVKIDINEDGNRIAICGERPVQETTMVGWQVYQKDVEMRGFRKAFKIPDGVILDEIKAGFNQDESMLTITMKKATKGIKGVTVEEVKEETMIRENSESLQVEEDKESSGKQASTEVADKIGAKKETLVLEEKDKLAQPSDTSSPTIQGNVASEESGFDEAALAELEDSLLDRSPQTDAPKRPKKLLCTPVIAGSSLLVSLIVFVIHLIRTKDKQEKKK